MWLTVTLSLVTYRVARLIRDDLIFDAPRARLYGWLITGGWLRRKLHELISCSFCLTIWIAAGAVLLTLPFASVPLPVWTWLASAAGSLIVWYIVEGR